MIKKITDQFYTCTGIVIVVKTIDDKSLFHVLTFHDFDGVRNDNYRYYTLCLYRISLQEILLGNEMKVTI